MESPFARLPDSESAYHVTPDEIDRLVGELTTLDPPSLKLDTFDQFTGRKAYAFTLTSPSPSAEDKHRLFVSRPHAHEPAGTAACTEFVKALLGYGAYSGSWETWRQWVLDRFLITLVPDANPGGSQRAPVKFWDGTNIPNERFFRWMFGESGEAAGERFPRVAAWDMREVTPPALLGIAYEQIDEHTYVEPNRDHRSTFFRSFFTLDGTYRYQVWLDFHQTEFQRSKWNAVTHLPTCQDDLPPDLQARNRSLGDAIHRAWQDAGGVPGDEPVVPYRTNETQRDFLTKVWLPISKRLTHVVTEVQNNNTRTPTQMQVRFQLTALEATLKWMDNNAPG